MTHNTTESVLFATFSQNELNLLADTADALTAWTGQAVICSILDLPNGGPQCAVFAMVAGKDEEIAEDQEIVLGGEVSKVLGNAGGVTEIHKTPYLCKILWSVVVAHDQERFLKFDANGEIIDHAEDLEEILPFSFNDIDPADLEEDEVSDDVRYLASRFDSEDALDDFLDHHEVKRPRKPTLH
ncbi:hypothetical protein [Brackiella oedipodis]|uniref:hypothetical protein n=1 Tax=Brackiella oedipodis TaxID=124225 RepID=UPI00048D3EE2|nr:hypothetical protein [Brackiella oedipodis]